MVPRDFIYPDPLDPSTSLIQLNGGQAIWVALPVFRRGIIKKLRVSQVAAALEGFTYGLYNSKIVYQIDGAVVLSTAATPGSGAGQIGVPASVYEPLYRIISLTVASGQPQYGSTEGFPEDGVSNLDLSYSSLDYIQGTSGGRSSNADHFLYLYLSAAGAAASKQFVVSMSIMDTVIT